jgi:AraC-like DNA-binding protein
MTATVLMLRYTVALLGTLLALGIGVHAWRQRSFGVGCLALWMAALALSAWAMVVMINPLGKLTPPGMLMCGLLTTLAGPLLLGYVTYAVRGVRLHWAWFLPFAVHAAACLVLGTHLNYFLGAIPVTMFEYCYTVAAWIVCLRHARPRSSQPAVIGVLAAVMLTDVGTGAGILDYLGFIDYRPIRQAPLVILIVWLAVALIMALTNSPLLRRLVPSLTPPAGDAERALFARIERLMQDEQPWSDPDFDVGTLARLLKTYPNAVSKALSRAGDTTFYDYVNAHRVREAQRLLKDPVESRFKVEALGRQAGFRARSTFFKLFRQHTGLTPAEYRASHGAGLNG